MPRPRSLDGGPPPDQILTAASANERHLLLSSDGVTLVTLDIPQMLIEVRVNPLGNGDQVSCIYVPGHIPNIGVIGFWKSGSISVLDLTTHQILHSEDLRRTDSASVPRNIGSSSSATRNTGRAPLYLWLWKME